MMFDKSGRSKKFFNRGVDTLIEVGAVRGDRDKTKNRSFNINSFRGVGRFKKIGDSDFKRGGDFKEESFIREFSFKDKKREGVVKGIKGVRRDKTFFKEREVKNTRGEGE